MKESLNSRIKELDQFIEDETAKWNQSILNLKKQRAKLIELQEYTAYKKWNIKENNCYVRFTNESQGILFEGIRIRQDDQINKRCTTISYLYRIYDEEASLQVKQNQISYIDLDDMLRTSDVYLVHETTFTSLLTKILELPDITKIKYLKSHLENAICY